LHHILYVCFVEEEKKPYFWHLDNGKWFFFENVANLLGQCSLPWQCTTMCKKWTHYHKIYFWYFLMLEPCVIASCITYPFKVKRCANQISMKIHIVWVLSIKYGLVLKNVGVAPFFTIFFYVCFTKISSLAFRK
jgi:hypothetical protein